MENINEEHLYLIAKHLRGETSVFEENLLKEWLDESDENKTVYKETVFLWNAGKTPASHIPDVGKAWEKVKARTQIGNTGSVTSSQEGKVRPMYDVWTYMKVAATVLLFLAIGYMTRTLWSDNEKMTELSSGDQKKEFYLPDSSRVWLNKNTKLAYSNSYNESNRTVQLDGEAFFEVKKDKEKPFIVNGRFSKTEVLGTSFNVRSLKNESSDKIEVVTGKVSFASKTKKENASVILLPGDQAAVVENGAIEKTKIDNSNFLAWKSNQLVFDNTPLKEVVEEMENYFNVHVKVENPELMNCRFTGTFNQPAMEEMLKVLSVSINLSYNKKDNTYLLTGKGCN